MLHRYIHSLGIYHLDLTPSNVLLTRSFRAKIADFGIAKDEEEIDAGKATVMVFGLVVLSAPQHGSCVHCWRAAKKCQYSIATCALSCVTHVCILCTTTDSCTPTCVTLCIQCMCTTIEAAASDII